MGIKDTRIDAYIEHAADFAKPILRHIRAAVHKGCPDVEETMKWGMPHFDHKGIMISMAAFKAHCVLGFWKASLMKDPYKVMNKTGQGEAMGHFGRIRSIADLPKEHVLISYVKEAARLNEEGGKVERKTTPKKPLRIPSFFLESVKKNKKALAAFTRFSPSAKREYIEWVTEAKTEKTRASRMKKAIEWMSEGKERNWKYQKR